MTRGCGAQWADEREFAISSRRCRNCDVACQAGFAHVGTCALAGGVSWEVMLLGLERASGDSNGEKANHHSYRCCRS
jgi:hypothetical protein